MPYTHKIVEDIVNNECGGNWFRLGMLSSSNGGRPIYFHEYTGKDRGWRYVNEGDGEGYRNGFEFYGPIPNSIIDQVRPMSAAGIPIRYQITFFPLDLIDHISWFPLVPPLWSSIDQPSRVNGDNEPVDEDGKIIPKDNTQD